MVQTQLPREMATSMERIHVQEVYDQIAPHFADLKQKAWPKVKQFLKSLDPGALVADVGCGNGRYLRINSSIYKIGSDVCQPLVDHANQEGHEVMAADNLHLPYRDGVFDAVVSIGVIHHFSSEAHRIKALKELARVLSPGGRVMVYVWAFEQKHRRFESQDVLIPWHKPSHPAHRLYRGSCSDVDHSSNSSVSDDDTSSLGSFQIQDSPPDDISGYPHRIKSLEDFHQSAEDVFEEAAPRAFQNGHLVKQHTLVEECRRLEACLKELSEKQLTSNELGQCKNDKSVFPTPKFNFRKKSCTEATTSIREADVCPKSHKGVGATITRTINVPTFLPCQVSPVHRPNCPYQENCIFSKSKHSHAKPNIFQKLKLSFQGLLASHEEKKDPCQESDLKQNLVLPKSRFEDYPELFAVREFPMSSLRPTLDQPVANKAELPQKNGVLPLMKRNNSDLSQHTVKKDQQQNNVIKLRSTSVKSLPLELASVDLAPNCTRRRRRVKSIGSPDTETNGNAGRVIPTEEINGTHGHERKLKLSSLQKGHSRSQGDLAQGKASRKILKKQATVSHDLAKTPCQSFDNDPYILANGPSRSAVRRTMMDSASSDSFMSSASGLSVSGTPTNADLCRYYHVFKEGELCDMVRHNIENLHIIDTYYDHANWCLIAEKVILKD